MPHRILPYVSSHLANLIEGALLTVLALCNGVAYVATAIADADWTKITGPHGVAFVSIVAVIVLWGNGIVREKKEDKRRAAEELAREKRHTETIALQKDNSEKLMAITVESIKAQGLATQAVNRMDSNIQRLTMELAERPCQAGVIRNPAQFQAVGQ